MLPVTCNMLSCPRVCLIYSIVLHCCIVFNMAVTNEFI